MEEIMQNKEERKQGVFLNGKAVEGNIIHANGGIVEFRPAENRGDFIVCFPKRIVAENPQGGTLTVFAAQDADIEIQSNAGDILLHGDSVRIRVLENFADGDIRWFGRGVHAEIDYNNGLIAAQGAESEVEVRGNEKGTIRVNGEYAEVKVSMNDACVELYGNSSQLWISSNEGDVSVYGRKSTVYAGIGHRNVYGRINFYGDEITIAAENEVAAENESGPMNVYGSNCKVTVMNGEARLFGNGNMAVFFQGSSGKCFGEGNRTAQLEGPCRKG